ncbi:hypothetical protein AVEN_88283-1 [Araneus ventricosus]|uniref:Uncharacterized protein n=1 Tax=Araneus ventricosus TaxID=182803 RepID=A0A4Y2EMI2_ARAVE|nr:hypothetical protein AVEN_88283-1 [Araneus ventricosus]
MKVLSNTSWVADKVSLMRISCSLEAGLWSASIRLSCQVHFKNVRLGHHQGLRIATGAFRTTRIPSLHVIRGEPSLELRRHRLLYKSLSYFYKIKSDESHPQHYKVINAIFGSLFSVRLSFTSTFGFRIGEILRYFEIEDFPIVSNVEDPSPWQKTQLDFIDDFLHFFKPSTSDNVFQQHFYDHRQRYSDYVPIYTEGSKSDNHVGSAGVFSDFTIAQTLHPFCFVYTSELYSIYLGLLKITILNFKKSHYLYRF